MPASPIADDRGRRRSTRPAPGAPRSIAEQNGNSANATTSNSEPDLGDVAEARVQDVVDDRPLDRVADARARRVRALQHQGRDRRDHEEDPADPDRAGGSSAPRSCRRRSAARNTTPPISSASPANTPARADAEQHADGHAALGVGLGRAAVDARRRRRDRCGTSTCRRPGCESAEMTRHATRYTPGASFGTDTIDRVVARWASGAARRW